MIMILLLKLMNYFSSKRGEYDHLENMMNHLEIITKSKIIFNVRIIKLQRIQEAASFNVRNKEC